MVHKSTLTVEQGHRLQLSSNQQLSLQRLQLSTLELAEEITQALAENPLLESVEEGQGEVSDSITDNEEEGWDLQAKMEPLLARDEPSLLEYLQLQLAYRATPLAEHIGWLIDELTEDGYLCTDLAELVHNNPDTVLKDWQQALQILQTFDPVGVAARNLSECLCLQIQARQALSPKLRSLAEQICVHHLPLLAEHSYKKLQKILQCGAQELNQVCAEIRALEPMPCRNFSKSLPHYIIPEIVVHSTRPHENLVALNPERYTPVQLSPLCAEWEKVAGGDLAPLFQQQLREAHLLVQHIQQRETTLLRLARVIVQQQADFFAQGAIGLQPLSLQEVADKLELHISTISRACQGKYMQTSRGLFPFKYFFPQEVSRSTEATYSVTAIQTLLQQRIATENSSAPYSDQDLMEYLQAQQIQVARRTISKYRTALGIPNASARMRRAEGV